MGVGVDEDLPRQGVALLGDEHVRDPVLAHGEVVRDVEARHELAQALGVVRRLDRGRRDHVVVQQDELFGVRDAENIRTRAVELHSDVDVDHYDVPRLDLLLIGVVREDLLDRVHAHRKDSSLARCGLVPEGTPASVAGPPGLPVACISCASPPELPRGARTSSTSPSADEPRPRSRTPVRAAGSRRARDSPAR